MGPTVTRLRGRGTFRALARARNRGRSGPVQVAFVPGEPGSSPRVAYAIGRRHGNAVRRNRLRRRLRACVRAAAQPARGHLPAGAYLVAADPAATGLSPRELEQRVGEALARASRPRQDGVPAPRAAGPRPERGSST